MNERVQDGVTARAASLDNQTGRVCQTHIDDRPRAFHRVLQVQFAPIAPQRFAVAAPEAGAAAVVHIQISIPTAGEKRRIQVKSDARSRSRAAVDINDHGGQAFRGVIAISGGVIRPIHARAVGGNPIHFPRDRQVGREEVVGAAAGSHARLTCLQDDDAGRQAGGLGDEGKRSAGGKAELLQIGKRVGLNGLGCAGGYVHFLQEDLCLPVFETDNGEAVLSPGNRTGTLHPGWRQQR